MYCYEGAWPQHHCKVPQSSLPNETIPKTDDGDYEKCLIYVANDTNKTTECSEWQYYDDDVGHTIVSQVTRLHRSFEKKSLTLHAALKKLSAPDHKRTARKTYVSS